MTGQDKSSTSAGDASNSLPCHTASQSSGQHTETIQFEENVFARIKFPQHTTASTAESYEARMRATLDSIEPSLPTSQGNHHN